MAGQELHGEITNWPAVEATIGAFPGHLRDAAREHLGKLADDIAEDVRRAVLQSPPTRGTGKVWGEHRSRQLTAAGVSSHVDADGNDTTAEVKVDPTGLGPARQAFPFAYNRNSWSHPVFGGPRMVSQQGNPYMDADQLASRYAGKVGTEMTAALGEAADTIKG
jgi:hypothetical protein